MKTLVIHPFDASTDFLKPIYERMKATVVTGGIDKNEVIQLIRNHDRIIMMGHGSPMGLFSVDAFDGKGDNLYIIDEECVSLIQKKKNNIYIWCHANKFVEKYKLNGFYTGMFISEITEAIMYDYDVEEEKIIESNDSFSKIVSEHINKTNDCIYQNVINQYSQLAQYNPIARFNVERMYNK